MRCDEWPVRWAGGVAADGNEGCCGESILLHPGAV